MDTVDFVDNLLSSILTAETSTFSILLYTLPTYTHIVFHCVASGRYRYFHPVEYFSIL